jgi:PilZ domain
MVLAQPTAPPPAERRVAVRRQPTVGTVCHLHPPTGQDLVGLVWNISTSGVSMLLHQRLEPGTTVPAEVRAAGEETALPVTLRVAHVSQLRTGDFILGAQFAQPLQAHEMQRFLPAIVRSP